MKKKKLGILLLTFSFFIIFTACSSADFKESTSDSLASENTSQLSADSSNKNTSLPIINPLTQQGMRQTNSIALTKDGFLSIEYQAIPDYIPADSSLSSSDFLGARVFYHDLRTMQSHPLTLPNDIEDGFLAIQKSSIASSWVYANNSKIIFHFDSYIVTMNYDFSDYKTIYTFDSSISIGQIYVNNTAIYVAEKQYDESTGVYKGQAIKKIDLDTGAATDLSIQLGTDDILFSDSANAFSSGNKIISLHYEKDPVNEKNVQAEYQLLDLDNQTSESLLVIDDKGKRLLPESIADNSILWSEYASENDNEPILYRYAITTKETKSFSLPNNTFINGSIWDDHISLVENITQNSNSQSYSFGSIDLTKGTISKFNSISSEDTLKYPIPTILAEYEDSYIVTNNTLLGAVLDGNENKALLDTEKSTDNSNENGYSLSPTTIYGTLQEYSLIKKEDYWNNNFNITPLIYL